MKFDLISDIHVDVWGGLIKIDDFLNSLTKKSDVLIVAGDVSNYVSSSVYFLEKAKQHYKTVIFVEGNHEYYSSIPMDDIVSYLKKSSNEIGFYYMDGTNYVIVEDVAIVGINMWYDFHYATGCDANESKYTWYKSSSDSRRITFKNSPEIMAKSAIDIIENTIKDLNENPSIRSIVVVTHTSPITEAILVKEDDDIWNSINGAYGCKEAQRLFKYSKITNWVFGHVHSQHDIIKDGIRYVVNPRGNPGEIQNFDTKTIEV
ncbi:MAG: metallophosphoesterase [Candidimonas sp.]